MSLKILAGFGTNTNYRGNSNLDYFDNTTGENLVAQLSREGYRVIRVVTMNQMLQELQIPQPFFFDPLRKGEEMHSEVNHSLTPGNPFDWVFMDTHLGQKVSSYDSAQRMYALLYEEILDGRIGFRSFTGNNFAERKAGAAGIPCIRWTDARELCRLYDVLRREAEDRRILQESIAASHV